MSYPQQPYGGQDPYGQSYGQGQPPYGQQPQYGQPQFGGGFTPGEPPKKNTGMIVASASGDPSTTKNKPTATEEEANSSTYDEEPTEETTDDIGGGADEEEILTVADEYLTALNNVDQSAATALVCNNTDAGILFTSFSSFGYNWIMDDTTVSATGGFATVDVYPDNDQSLTVPLSLTEESGSWCVAY